jgi:hypothetical protein
MPIPRKEFIVLMRQAIAQPRIDLWQPPDLF